MLIEKVLEEARPYLENETIKDAVLGLSLIGIELENSDLGLAYMLRDRLPAGCSSFGFAQDVIGKNAYEIAKLAIKGNDDAQRGVGMAVLTAGSRQLDLPDEDPQLAFWGLEVKKTDRVGMIGLIPPIAKRFAEVTSQVVVFDKGVSHSGGEKAKMVFPMEKQAELLPQCDLLIVTGSAMINGSIDQILDWSKNARDIIMIGSSTPMYPEAFKDCGVTVLAGAWWDQGQKTSLFKKISLSGGISHVQPAMIKKAASVKGL